MLSDQSPNVDGASVRDFLEGFNIEKRYSSAYHLKGDHSVFDRRA